MASTANSPTRLALADLPDAVVREDVFRFCDDIAEASDAYCWGRGHRLGRAPKR